VEPDGEKDGAVTKVLLEMSMSLDGYVTGPDVGPDEPMGRGGERLHEWMFEGRSDAEVERFESEHFKDIGAVIVGRRMADLGIRFWGEEPTFHAPVFVVTNRPAETIDKAGGTSYVFVTDGIDEALRRAREAAGSADVMVGGGAQIARQYLRAGAIEELRLHLVPTILGGGTPLFDEGPSSTISLRPIEVAGTPSVTHLTYEATHPAGG
jgi:dihydrofolate reductase